MRTDERFAVLSALIDREPVDPDALALALDDPAGRAELVDFVRVRSRMSEALGLEDRGGIADGPHAGGCRHP